MVGALPGGSGRERNKDVLRDKNQRPNGLDFPRGASVKMPNFRAPFTPHSIGRRGFGRESGAALAAKYEARFFTAASGGVA